MGFSKKRSAVSKSQGLFPESLGKQEQVTFSFQVGKEKEHVGLMSQTIYYTICEISS